LALDIRSRMVDRMQRLSLQYHDSRGTADSLYRIQYDAPAIQNILVDGAIPFVTATITLSTMIVATARLDWPLALVALGVCAVLFIGVQHVQAGLITLGQLLMVLGYLAQLYDPLKTISRKAAGIQAYLASAERVFALLDEPSDVPERVRARPLPRATGAVTFR